MSETIINSWNSRTFGRIVLGHASETLGGRVRYSPVGHDDAACPVIPADAMGGIRDGSLDQYLVANEFFDGEIEFDPVWPCGTCVSVDTKPRALSFLAEHHGETERVPAGESAEREPYVRPEVEGEDEAIAFAKAYEGNFEFMVSMRAKCSRPVPRLSPKMISAILRCKARAESAPAASDVRVNNYAGTCGSCRSEVAEKAGRIEKVDGRWVTFHLDGTCPSKAPESAGEQRTAAPAPSVPAGRYAFTTEAGETGFAKVDTPTEGRWAGRTFVNLLIGSSGDYREEAMRGAAGQAILRKIADAGIEESARRFGREARRCGFCMGHLTLTQSRAAGYGSTCAGNHGLYYPSKAEAKAILDREGIDLDGITDL